ncbi:MAG: hypothetical protein QOD06_1455 [Candidatus Binatota bacterium]|nr:hypothetical protein [Candidatus Binatota bacterium]
MAALVVLAPVVAVVVYSSFEVSDYECDVCVSFDGRESCRKVTAKTEADALRGAIDNACALVASGVTQTMRCTRSEPTRSTCRSLVEKAADETAAGS